MKFKRKPLNLKKPMPTPIDIALLIPAFPLISVGFSTILFLSFTRTISRLSKPVGFLLVSSFGASSVISYLLLRQEFSKEVIKRINIDWQFGFSNFGINLNIIIDKAQSIILSVICSIIFILFLASHFYKSGKKDYVSYFIYLGIICTCILIGSLTPIARSSLSMLL